MKTKPKRTEYWREYYHKNRERKRQTAREGYVRCGEIKRRYSFRRHRSKLGCVIGLYKGMRYRVCRDADYLGRKLLIERRDFLLFCLKNDRFHEIHRAWQLGGYSKKLAPTVDRIDNGGHYEGSNIQILTMSENVIKGHSERKAA